MFSMPVVNVYNQSEVTSLVLPCEIYGTGIFSDNHIDWMNGWMSLMSLLHMQVSRR